MLPARRKVSPAYGACDDAGRQEVPILHYSIVFLVFALIAAFLGFSGLAGMAAGFAKILFIAFLVIWLVTFFLGRRGRTRI